MTTPIPEDPRHKHDRRYSLLNHRHDNRYEQLGVGMVWYGTWTGGEYPANAVVRDGDWLMIANKETSDRPAPQPIGEPFYLYQGGSPITQQTAKQITYGARYSWQTSGYLMGWRAWFVAGNHYTVWSVEDPDGAAILRQLLDVDAEQDGWVQFGLTPQLTFAGTVFEVLVLVREPDPSPSTWAADWNYDTPNNSGVPAAGVVQHANSNLAELRIHKTDNGGTDRGAALLALTNGDVIEALGTRWAVQQITDQGNWVGIAIAPAQQTAPDGVTTFTFETTTATPITYVEDTNYWPGSPYAGAVQGVLDGVLNNNAYGVDLLVQEGTSSPDWDLMAVSNL